MILVGHGSYRLTVATGGPVPVVTFDKATGPQFEPIRTVAGNLSGCDATMGAVTVQRSPNASPLLYHVARELYGLAKVEWGSSQRPHLEFAYRDYGNLMVAVESEMLLVGFRQILASIASDLIRRYANPASGLTDKGAKWVAETAVAMMMQSYVEGRDPGLIIDGLLTRMVDHLQGHADNLAQAIGGAELKLLLKPHLTAIADDVKRALVEAQPDAQTVTLDASSTDDACHYFLSLVWNFKGGSYRGVLTIRCGDPAQDGIERVNAVGAAVDPGARGTITAEALSQLGVPIPLAAAAVTGVAPVQAAGAGEPPAVIAARQATFDFVADDPRHDEDYPYRAQVTTIAEVGSLVGIARGVVTVRNVAPEIIEMRPAAASAAPGDRLVLDGATVVVRDANGDARGASEVVAASLTLAHPDGLNTAPHFDHAGNPRRLSHDAGSGTFTLGFDRSGRVAEVHEHGSWPVTIAVQDDNGLTATTIATLTVTDVAPTVVSVNLTPDHVHRGQGKRIDVSARVRDANGADDITAVRIDARAAGGAVYTLDDGLVETGRGEDWIDVRLAVPFPQTDDLGAHPVLVSVNDEAHQGDGTGTLHVGNVAPTLGGYGYLTGFDSPAVVGDLSPAQRKGLCPRERFRVGIIAHDAEGDPLQVTATIVETGEQATLSQTSDGIWVGEMRAPQLPQVYTLRVDVAEVPPDKSSAVTMMLEVVDCAEEKEEESRAAVDPDAEKDAIAVGQPFTPADIADAPRDAGSQVMVGSFGGVVVPAMAAAGPGPDAAALLDTIQTLLSGEASVTDGVRPPVETYLLATGGSTGPVIQFLGLNRGGVPAAMPSGAVVFEPVSITPATQARVTALLQAYLAAGGQAQLLDAYCLELFRTPPRAGTLMRIAAAPLQQRFQGVGRILDAVKDLDVQGLLHPDSDIDGYLHAIRQWSIWTDQERLDLTRFGNEFVRTTRANVEQQGGRWSDEVEQAVRRLVPGRWTDVQAVLARAEAAQP